MARKPQPDTFDWFGALKRSTEQARNLRPAPKPTPDPCLCGSTDIRGRIITTPVDLTGQDVTVTRIEGVQHCRACAHGISHGAMGVATHMTNTSVVRDHYHVACTQI